MKDKLINSQNIEGKIYQFDLQEKVSGPTSKNPGQPYIAGTIDVATTSAQDNIVQVHYTWVTPAFKNGNANPNYSVLKQIINSGKTVVTDGYDAATIVRLSPSYALNEFFPEGQDKPVSQARNEGGFISIIPESMLHPENDVARSRFEYDIVINNAVEIVPEEGDSYVSISGIVFNFKKEALPITLTARNKDAGKYFLDLGATNDKPVFTTVWGKIVNVLTKTEKVQESAFGSPKVDTITRRTKEYVITGANPTPYEFDTEATITTAELQKVLQDREVYLAELKKSAEEWRANRNASSNAVPAAQATQANAVPSGGFKF